MMTPNPNGIPNNIGAIQCTLGESVAANPAIPITIRTPPQIAEGRRSSGVARPPRFLAVLMYCGLT
jgi:hypothetical protein